MFCFGVYTLIIEDAERRQASLMFEERPMNNRYRLGEINTANTNVTSKMMGIKLSALIELC